MAYSKTILLVVFAVLLITAEVSAHRDLSETTAATTDGRSGYNRGEGGGKGGIFSDEDGRGGYNKGNGGNGGGKGGNGGGKGGNGGGKGGNGGSKGGNGGGKGGNGGNGGGEHGPETQN
ncbi:PREDICTED: glycine, alanine and asparagine-rich protein-like [Fragaria vesca subsp. vesca]|uniref:glycine, alanine and asparagine-rich protein-like n=1 Tax=Fragaria vesca subsp. vesca TaxID=101020 RepID=UPI0002C3549C|nr:PREDICTED: glycine, alanine and asparagine-rich protein-like [Fragaria vesca subsp. vesca]